MCTREVWAGCGCSCWCLPFLFVAMRGFLESAWWVGGLSGSRWEFFVERALETGDCCSIGWFGAGGGAIGRMLALGVAFFGRAGLMPGFPGFGISGWYVVMGGGSSLESVWFWRLKYDGIGV